MSQAKPPTHKTSQSCFPFQNRFTSVPLKVSLLNFNFVMIYIIHKMLVLLKNHLNYLKNSIFKCFFKEYRLFLIIFSQHIKMESLSLEEKNIIKDIRNLFNLEKETQTIKERILRYIKVLFQYQEEDCYKPVVVNNFWGNNCIEYRCKGDGKHYQLKNILIKLNHT